MLKFFLPPNLETRWIIPISTESMGWRILQRAEAEISDIEGYKDRFFLLRKPQGISLTEKEET